jgi:hypothetical protein
MGLAGEIMEPEPQRNALVKICGGYAEVETALRSLRAHGCALNGVSVVGQQLSSGHEVVGCYQIGRSCKYWGPLAAFWEGLWEILDGSGVFWMKDFGAMLVAGSFITTVVASLEHSSIFSGLTLIGSALYSLAIPLEDAVGYEADLKESRLLLIVQGPAAAVEKAGRLLEQYNGHSL